MKHEVLTSWVAALVVGSIAGLFLCGQAPVESAGIGVAHLCVAVAFAIRPKHKVYYTPQHVHQNQSFRSTSFACHTEYCTTHVGGVPAYCNISVDIVYAICLLFPVGDARGSDCIVPVLLTMMCVYRGWRVHGPIALLCAFHASRFSARHTVYCLRVWTCAWLAPCVTSPSAVHLWLSAWHLVGSHGLLFNITIGSVLQAPVLAAVATGLLHVRPSVFTSVCYVVVSLYDVCTHKIHYS